MPLNNTERFLKNFESRVNGRRQFLDELSKCCGCEVIFTEDSVTYEISVEREAVAMMESLLWRYALSVYCVYGPSSYRRVKGPETYKFKKLLEGGGA